MARLQRVLADLKGGADCLDLSGACIGDSGARALAEALKTSATLRVLNLPHNEIGSDGMCALADALRVNASLQALDLYDNSIDAEGARALADALKTNKTLNKLRLSQNMIGADGARALADALKSNAALRSLELLTNGIGNEGARAFANTLRTNATLQTLDLRWNGIGADGARSFVDALKMNATLRKLYLQSNGIPSSIITMIDSIIFSPGRLTAWQTVKSRAAALVPPSPPRIQLCNLSALCKAMESHQSAIDGGAATLADQLATQKAALEATVQRLEKELAAAKAELHSFNTICSSIGEASTSIAASIAAVKAEMSSLERIVDQLDDCLMHTGIEQLQEEHINVWLTDIQAPLPPKRTVPLTGEALLAYNAADLASDFGYTHNNACHVLLHAYMAHHNLANPVTRPPPAGMLAWDVPTAAAWLRGLGNKFAPLKKWDGAQLASLNGKWAVTRVRIAAPALTDVDVGNLLSAIAAQTGEMCARPPSRHLMCDGSEVAAAAVPRGLLAWSAADVAAWLGRLGGEYVALAQAGWTGAALASLDAKGILKARPSLSLRDANALMDMIADEKDDHADRDLAPRWTRGWTGCMPCARLRKPRK